MPWPSRLSRVAALLATCTAVACTAPAAPEPAPPPLVDVQLLALNDFHGNLEPPSGSTGVIAGAPAGGAEFLAAQLRSLEVAAGHPNTITVAAGDLIGASPLLSAAFHDEPAVESLGLAGLDLASVGNHEFDEGRAELLRIQNGGCHPVDGCADPTRPYRGAGFQYLSANVLVDEGGQPLLPPTAVQEVQGARIGFIGMTLEGTADIVSLSGVEGLKFADEVQTANTYAGQLRAQGVEAIVVLLHEGGIQGVGGGINDCSALTGPIVEIAHGIDDAVDVVVSGHTHRAYNCVLDGKVVTSASSFGRLVTDIDLTLDRGSGDIVRKTARNVVVDRQIPSDPAQSELIGRYRTLLGPIASRQVGVTSAAITRTQEVLLSGDPPVLGQSPLGNLIADAQLAATDEEQGAVAALMNPGGVRAELDAGPVTFEEAFSVQPFNNNLTTLDLTGAQLQCLLEQQFTLNRVLLPAGVRYSVDPAGASAPGTDPCAGTRVPDASLTIAGRPVEPATSYRITVNSFLADGGDGFSVLREGSNRVVGGLDIDALVTYLTATQPTAPPTADRITVTGS